ncbi:MAG: dihydropteroate synthase [Planctomycetota bacterium]|nr:dihydropteroate synthase [Planctomycetota bacterium]MEE2895631.1 dihydropteroate synthase [Planctomycetota bacterium]
MSETSRRHWRLSGERTVELDPCCLMGILNATPDSFSDGGDHLDAEAAATAGRAMVRAGAGILDVGGESTRPGAERVPVAEQIERVVPVVRALRRDAETAGVAITVDTTRAAVAEAAIEAGADAINDVSAGLEDDSMLDLAARLGVGIVLMHRLRPPDEDVYSDRYTRPPAYEDVVDEVEAFLEARAVAAEAAGVRSDSIVVDPGLGFGKSVEQNLEILHRIDEFGRRGRLVLAGASRKSFLGAIAGRTDPRDRLVESVVAGIEAVRRGAAILRVHDVEPHARAIRVLAAVGSRAPAAD